MWLKCQEGGELMDVNWQLIPAGLRSSNREVERTTWSRRQFVNAVGQCRSGLVALSDDPRCDL